MYRTPDFSPSTSRYVPQRTDTPFKQTQPASYLLDDHSEYAIYVLLTHHRK